MPSVPAVSSGEILDVVVAPPAPRGDSGSNNGDRFEDVLAGASQGRASEGAVPPASSTGKSKEPQGEISAPKGKGAESSPRDSASAGASAPGEKKPDPAASSGGQESQARKPGEAEEGEGEPVSSGGKDDVPPGQEKAAEVISQLIAAGVLGLAQLTDGAPVAPDGENGLKLGAAQAAPARGQGVLEQVQANALGLDLADAALAQEEGADGETAAPPAAAKPAQAGAALAGAVFVEEGPETVSASGEAAEADVSAEVLQAAAPGGEDFSAPGEEGVPQAQPLDDGLPSDEFVTARGSGSFVPEAAPEETAEAPAAPPAAGMMTEADGTEGGGRPDWTRFAELDGADAPETPVQTAAPAVPPAGEGDFGPPADGEEPGHNLLAGRQAAAQAADGPSRNAAAGAPAGPPADPFLRTEVHRQVMEAALSRMSIAVREGMAQARIQLDPPSLGRLHMELRMQDGAMNAKVTVETAWAKEAVMSGLRELREALQRQGVSLENFSVDVRASLNPGSFGQDRAGNQGEGAFYLESVPEDESAAYSPDRGPVFASSSLSGDGSINIFA